LPRNAVQSIERVGIGESKWKFRFTNHRSIEKWAMSMKISLFYELTTQDPDVPGAVKQRFDEALEQIRYADELG